MKKAPLLGILLLLGAFFIVPNSVSANNPHGNFTISSSTGYTWNFGNVSGCNGGGFPNSDFHFAGFGDSSITGQESVSGCSGTYFHTHTVSIYTVLAQHASSTGLYYAYFCGATGCTAGAEKTGAVKYAVLYWDGANIYFPNQYGFVINNIWYSIDNGNIFTSSAVDIVSAFNSGGLSTTTMGSFCDTNMPYDDSDIIQATITFVPNGLCRLAIFLIVPTTGSLNQFSLLASTTQDRFPFAYVASVASTWTALTASTTANSPTFTYNLADLTLGSTTPMGNILPNITVLSSTTVQSYFPAGTFSALKALAGIAIILVLIGDIFFSTKRMMK